MIPAASDESSASSSVSERWLSCGFFDGSFSIWVRMVPLSLKGLIGCWFLQSLEFLFWADILLKQQTVLRLKYELSGQY